ncbi:hypothetical protein [Natrarchaeobius chitinivorans]|uniref:Uncharacterized protein n=1 Tax=Natrarchaeobius chitinivorans TaxID=1679083 RepID=A0A3N6LVR2_NATCH|nr:hypothetical protein [Natrarchaeobius chitinivorans]RQG94578.1 hypothetical protein EA473_10850 [Natrarchaeobius chitinivorans]
MSSEREAAGAESVDDSELRCDRCGDPIRENRVIHLSSDPCPALAGRYVAVTETYCPDCVAGIGMLAFVAETRARSSPKPE